MPRVVQSGEFFVVGGPVQPDRACYIERPADGALRQGLAERRFCYVLGPKASGKTSLMARTIRKLRADGQLAAVVDLTQIGARGESAEAGRWYYNIAYRIVRELRLRVDLQTWWQEKSVLVSEQRLADFFWEIVLTNTTAPVNIFFDEVERAAELPFSRELLVALSACYDGRATEPDYQRLNFAIIGVATPRQLGHGLTLPLFEGGLAVDPSDFTLEETYRLAEGFEFDDEPARAALNRIYHWVKGQPYLTQKIARAVARRRGSVEDVDNVVRGQFLGEGAREEEPLLNHMATFLTQRGQQHRRALVLLGQLAKGAPIVVDVESRSQELLSLAGITATADEEFLTYRSRLMRAVFTTRWVRSALPFDWRGAAAIAAAVAIMILLPLWYAQYFPRPYIETLTGITNDYALAIDTHDKLRRFPGFGGRADALLAEIMVRRSESAEVFDEVQAADAVLRTLDGYADVADRLIGEYWLRRGREALLSGRRDDALIYADRARVGGDAQADALAARLIDVDYPQLRQSLRFGSSLAQWEADWTSQRLVTIDNARRARRLDLTGPREPLYETQVTAPQHVPVSRALGVDEPGSAGGFLFEIDIEHPDVQQIMLTLEAPSGASASFVLPSTAGTHHEVRVTERSELATLADEDRRGVWRLTLVDRSEGAVGRLLRWGLLFAEELRGWQDVPDGGLDIPDPVRTTQIQVQLGADGRIGVARPARPDALGALTIWDFEQGRMLGDLQLDALPTYSALTPDATRLITVSSNALTIWDIEARSTLARIATQTGFALPPAIGVDGEYIAIAEQVDADEALYSLLRADDGELVASIEGTTGVRDWVLGPQARYLMLVGPGRAVRVIDPRRNETLLELPHAYDPSLLAATTEDLAFSVDMVGDIYVWDLSETERNVAGQFVGVTVDPLGVSLAHDGTTVAYEAEHNHVVVRDLRSNAIRLSVRVSGASGSIRTRLADDGSRLITASGTLLQLWDVPAPSPGAAPQTHLSAATLDATAQIAALGFRDGHLEIRTTAQIQEGIDAQDDIAYIGHQGAVASLAVNSARGLIASGGLDGVVRVWDLATGAPTEPYMRHPEGPIRAVTVSRDGSWLVSGADGSARAWRAQNGELALELPVNGTALAVAMSPDSTRVAAADSAGNVFVAQADDAASVRAGRAQAAVTALAFSADGRRLASGDRSGRIQLWDPVDARPVGGAIVLPQSVRWLGFSDDGEFLVAQTAHWIHRLHIDPVGLTIVATRLVGIDREPGAPSVPGMDAVRIVGGRDSGVASVEEIAWNDTAAPPMPDTRSIDRDWPGILGLRIDDRSDIEAVRY